MKELQCGDHHPKGCSIVQACSKFSHACCQANELFSLGGKAGCPIMITKHGKMSRPVITLWPSQIRCTFGIPAGHAAGKPPPTPLWARLMLRRLGNESHGSGNLRAHAQASSRSWVIQTNQGTLAGNPQCRNATQLTATENSHLALHLPAPMCAIPAAYFSRSCFL